MADVTIDEAALRELLQRAGLEAIQIVGGRIVDDARPLTGILRTKPPGRGSYPYPVRPGQLRESIHDEIVVDEEGQANYIRAQVPLGYYRNIGGHGIAAYGGSRGDNPAIGIAVEMQRGRSVP